MKLKFKPNDIVKVSDEVRPLALSLHEWNKDRKYGGEYKIVIDTIVNGELAYQVTNGKCNYLFREYDMSIVRKSW